MTSTTHVRTAFGEYRVLFLIGQRRKMTFETISDDLNETSGCAFNGAATNQIVRGQDMRSLLRAPPSCLAVGDRLVRRFTKDS